MVLATLTEVFVDGDAEIQERKIVINLSRVGWIAQGSEDGCVIGIEGKTVWIKESFEEVAEMAGR